MAAALARTRRQLGEEKNQTGKLDVNPSSFPGEIEFLFVRERLTSWPRLSEVVGRNLDSVPAPLLDLGVLPRHPVDLAAQEGRVAWGHGRGYHVHVEVGAED